MSNIFLKSPGGSGTRYLYSCFGKENLCGGRKWFNPHQRFNNHFKQDDLVFYVMAHPLNILLSFQKEGFFDPHHRTIENLQGDVNSWRQYNIDSIWKYAEVGINMFDFSGHYHKHKLDTDNQIIPLVYENLKEDVRKIPLIPITNNPFRKRRSDYTQEDPKLIGKLRKIHQNDILFYEHYKTIKL